MPPPPSRGTQCDCRLSWGSGLGTNGLGNSPSQQHSPEDLFPFEHIPPSGLAGAATGPETQPGDLRSPPNFTASVSPLTFPLQMPRSPQPSRESISPPEDLAMPGLGAESRGHHAPPERGGPGTHPGTWTGGPGSLGDPERWQSGWQTGGLGGSTGRRVRTCFSAYFCSQGVEVEGPAVPLATSTLTSGTCFHPQGCWKVFGAWLLGTRGTGGSELPSSPAQLYSPLIFQLTSSLYNLCTLPSPQGRWPHWQKSRQQAGHSARRACRKGG